MCLMWSCFLAVGAVINHAAVLYSAGGVILQYTERFIVWNSGKQTVTVVNSGDVETVEYCLPS